MREQYGELIGQLIGIFADTTPDALAQLRDASERGDGETTRAVAHTLKGACQNVGATAMADLCRGLEADPAASGLERLQALFAPTLTALRDAAASDPERAHQRL